MVAVAACLTRPVNPVYSGESFATPIYCLCGLSMMNTMKEQSGSVQQQRIRCSVGLAWLSSKSRKSSERTATTKQMAPLNLECPPALVNKALMPTMMTRSLCCVSSTARTGPHNVRPKSVKSVSAELATAWRNTLNHCKIGDGFHLLTLQLGQTKFSPCRNFLVTCQLVSDISASSANYDKFCLLKSLQEI